MNGDVDETGERSGEHGADDPVGSVAEEAAKLFGALSGWAREQSDGVAGFSAGFAGLSEDLRDHLATGAPECQWCPVCRTVHAVRQASPEAKAQLASAASTFLQAAAGLLAAAGSAESRADSRVQHIDLDADDPDDTDDRDEDLP